MAIWPFKTKSKKSKEFGTPVLQLIVTAPYLCNSLESHIMGALENSINVFIFPSAPAYTMKLMPVGYGIGLQFYTMLSGEIRATYLISPSPDMPIKMSNYPHSIHDWQGITFAWQNTWDKYCVAYSEVKSGNIMEFYNECKREAGLYSSQQDS